MLTAGTAMLATIVALPLPAAAGSSLAPLSDGWRPAPAVITVTAHAFRAARPQAARVRPSAVTPSAVTPSGGDPCSDRAWSPRPSKPGYVLWNQGVRWWFQALSTPSGLGKRATERALKRSITNITGARNDCGRADNVKASAIYRGRTDRRPAPTAKGGCRGNDGYNVVGFGRLPAGIAGLTCVYSSNGRIIEADITLDRDARWAVSLGSCSVASMVEAVATHEFGHVFGLGHVSETEHGRLTMSQRLDGYCQLNEATLGKGDMLGLESRY
jgi:hypothetical protein